MRILVVDDSEERVSLIKSSFSKATFFKYLNITYCDSADGARKELMSPCDLLVLDILIPKKKYGTPQAKHSVAVLSDICNPAKSYIRPRLIIGLTADIKELGGYQEQFAKEASVVLRGSMNELNWLDNLLAQVESLLSAQRKISQQQKEMMLISVHGIRTYGQWQAKLSAEISHHSRSFECVEVKYGFLDLLSFAIPYFRKKVIQRVAERVKCNIRNNPDREIHVIAHSFGTLIVSSALKDEAFKGRLRNVIFCGSPLPSNENIEHVVQSAELTLNECGIRDLVLIFARIFISGLGDAGRVGFERENSDRFANRYFRGGHSLYFKRFDDNSIFYERFWLKFIVSDQSPERFDARRNYIGEDLVEITINILAFIKAVFYILIRPIAYVFLPISQYVERLLRVK